MNAVGLALLLLYDAVVCIIEIPKMKKQKLIRELVTFSVLLLYGTSLGIMKVFDLKIPNPSDFVAWVYSPVKNLLKLMVSS